MIGGQTRLSNLEHSKVINQSRALEENVGLTVWSTLSRSI